MNKYILLFYILLVANYTLHCSSHIVSVFLLALLFTLIFMYSQHSSKKEKKSWPTNDAPPAVREATSTGAAWPGGEAPHRPFWAQRGLFCHHVRAGLISPTRALNRAERGLREQGGENRARRCFSNLHSLHMCWNREWTGCRQSLCLPKKTLCSRGSWWVLMLHYSHIHSTNKACELLSLVGPGAEVNAPAGPLLFTVR